MSGFFRFNTMKDNITTIYIDNLVSESKQFLHKLRSANNGDTKTSGIRIQLLNKDGEQHNTLIYEQHVYVVVVPHGQKEKAMLYGNWDEAIKASQRLLMIEHALPKNHPITLIPYTQVI